MGIITRSINTTSSIQPTEGILKLSYYKSRQIKETTNTPFWSLQPKQHNLFFEWQMLFLKNHEHHTITILSFFYNGESTSNCQCC